VLAPGKKKKVDELTAATQFSDTGGPTTFVSVSHPPGVSTLIAY
jgi:hypothetical protein